MSLERIKSFFIVKHRNDVMNGLEGINALLGDIRHRTHRLTVAFDTLKHQSEMFFDKGDKLTTDISKRVDLILKETNLIESERNNSKDEVFNTVADEFDRIINEGERERIHLEEKLRDIRGDMKAAKVHIKSLQTELKSSKKETREIGTQLVVEDLNIFEPHSISYNYLNKTEIFIMDGKEQSEEWASVLITDIMMRKLEDDYNCWENKQPLMPLNKFILEYFLEKFVSNSLSLTLLKDFLMTLKMRWYDSLKFSIFLDLAGFSYMKGNVKASKKKDENSLRELKKAIISTQAAYCFYLNIMMKIISKKEYYSDYLIPIHDSNSNYLIPGKFAGEIITEVLSSEGFEREVINSHIEAIKTIAERDMYDRILRNKLVNQSESEKNPYISSDYFAAHLLEIFAEHKAQKLYSLYASLKLYCTTYSDTSLNYTKYCQAVTSSVPNN